MPEINIGGPVTVIGTPTIVDVTPPFSVGHTTNGATVLTVTHGTSWVDVLPADANRSKVYLFNTGTVDIFVLPNDATDTNALSLSPRGIPIPARSSGPASFWHESYDGPLCAIVASGSTDGQLQIIEF